MDPMNPGSPSDPMGSMASPPRSGAPKAFVILLALLVVALFVGLGALIFSLSGDDSGDDEGGSVEASASAPADEEADDDPADDTEGEDEGEGEDPGVEPDADLDGVPDAEDDDDDDDGQPDSEDADDDGDGVPDTEEPGGDDGDDEPGDEPSDEDDEDDGADEPAPALDLLRNDPRPAVDDWIGAVGANAKAIEVLLYPTYGFLEVRDPDRPQKILDFGWRDGEMEGPEPGDLFPGTDLDAESFRMNAVAWDALPRLVANAPERANLPRGEVTHVIVTSDLPFSSRFLFRIYVTAPNGSDYVVATIDGQPAQR